MTRIRSLRRRCLSQLNIIEEPGHHLSGTSAHGTPGETPQKKRVSGEERNVALDFFILINANIGFCTEERGRPELVISLGCIGGRGV